MPEPLTAAGCGRGASGPVSKSGGDGVGSTGTTSAAGETAASERRNIADAAGIVVLAACAVWSLITAAAHDGRPEGVLLALLAVAAGYAAGRIAGALLPVAAPAGALAGLGLALPPPHAARPADHLAAGHPMPRPPCWSWPRAPPAAPPGLRRPSGAAARAAAARRRRSR